MLAQRRHSGSSTGYSVRPRCSGVRLARNATAAARIGSVLTPVACDGKQVGLDFAVGGDAEERLVEHHVLHHRPKDARCRDGVPDRQADQGDQNRHRDSDPSQDSSHRSFSLGGDSLPDVRPPGHVSLEPVELDVHLEELVPQLAPPVPLARRDVQVAWVRRGS